MRPPRLTEKVLSGLCAALNRMEADDLTDLPDDEDEEFQAARDWLDKMYAYRAEKREPHAPA